MAWGDNFYIYLENLSTYYIFSLILSFSAVFLSLYLHFLPKSNSTSSTTRENKMKTSQEPETIEAQYGNSDTDLSLNDAIISKFKMSRQQAIVDKLTANLTEEQLHEEKEAESQQLAAILNLLKEQQEKFKVASMEELENQMKLYR